MDLVGGTLRLKYSQHTTLNMEGLSLVREEADDFISASLNHKQKLGYHFRINIIAIPKHLQDIAPCHSLVLTGRNGG